MDDNGYEHLASRKRAQKRQILTPYEQNSYEQWFFIAFQGTTNGARDTERPTWRHCQRSSSSFTSIKCLGVHWTPSCFLCLAMFLCSSSTSFFAFRAHSQSFFTMPPITSLHTTTDSVASIVSCTYRQNTKAKWHSSHTIFMFYINRHDLLHVMYVNAIYKSHLYYR